MQLESPSNFVSFVCVRMALATLLTEPLLALSYTYGFIFMRLVDHEDEILLFDEELLNIPLHIATDQQ